MKKCDSCGHIIADNVDRCPYCGLEYKPSRGGSRRKDENKSEGKSKKPLIILFVLAGVVIALGITATILFMSQNKPKVKTFDYTCAEYTEQMNRLLGSDLLDQNKWVEHNDKDGFTYTDAKFDIDLDTDKDSQKVKRITVGPSDSEDGVKMASASMMTADPKLNQPDSMNDLVALKTGEKAKVVRHEEVATYDKNQKRYVIEPRTKENEKITDAAKATTAPETQAQTKAEAKATEAVTEQETEEETTTEAVTEASTDWRQKYIDYINSGAVSVSRGALIYLNDDDVPELVITPKNDTQWTSCYLCYIGSDGSVQSFQSMYGDVNYGKEPNYIERGGYLSMKKSSSFTINIQYIYFDGSSASEAHKTEWMDFPETSGTTYEDKYTIDGAEVTKEEVEAYPSTLGTFAYVGDGADSSGLESYIKNF